MGTFIDPGGPAQASDFTASVEVANDTGTITDTVAGTVGAGSVAGEFTVTCPTITLPDPNYDFFTITVSKGGANLGSFGIEDESQSAPLLAASDGADLTGAAGEQFSSVKLATFSVGSSSNTPAPYYANVYWGNGSSAQGQVVSDGGGVYEVDGTPDYDQAGSFPITVDISDGSQGLGVVYDTAIIAPAALSVTLVDASAIANTLFDGTVATFTDPNTQDSNFIALINWQPSNNEAPYVSTGAVSFNNGTGTISASDYLYSQAGSYPVSVQLYSRGRRLCSQRRQRASDRRQPEHPRRHAGSVADRQTELR